MYIPQTMKMDDVTQAFDLIEAFPFGVLVSTSGDSALLSASHLPFIVDQSQGSYGTLLCHFARANPQWKSLDGEQVLVIFSGPHSYISPTWYAHLPAVPTWNYSAVHVTGVLRIDSDEQSLALLQSMVQAFEPDLLSNQDVMSREYVEKLAAGIVGARIEITAIEGKFKLGQHKKIADQQGVFAQLKASHRPESRQLALFMEHLGIGIGL